MISKVFATLVRNMTPYILHDSRQTTIPFQLFEFQQVDVPMTPWVGQMYVCIWYAVDPRMYPEW